MSDIRKEKPIEFGRNVKNQGVPKAKPAMAKSVPIQKPVVQNPPSSRTGK
jgi:hypothetical protein